MKLPNIICGHIKDGNIELNNTFILNLKSKKVNYAFLDFFVLQECSNQIKTIVYVQKTDFDGFL